LASALLCIRFMAKKTPNARSSAKKTRSSSKRGSQKRDTVKSRTATLYAKRTSRGRFEEMDEKGRSLAVDRRRRAKTRTKSGYGDRGDRAA
jgi:hypothetical protein